MDCEVAISFEFHTTHFAGEYRWCRGVLRANVLSEGALPTKLLPTVFALVVAHLQVDTAKVCVQSFLITKTLVTCVAKMFGLSLILTTKIVLSQVVFL